MFFLDQIFKVHEVFSIVSHEIQDFEIHIFNLVAKHQFFHNISTVFETIKKIAIYPNIVNFRKQ